MTATAKPNLRPVRSFKKEPLPTPEPDIKPRITVMGIGGGGTNAVNNMMRSKLEGVTFVVCNTDAQALEQSECDNCIQLGPNITQGLGAGSRPDVGQAAAEESMDDIMEYLEGTHMLFITAGMGGGTGTGAAPVIAHAAREMGILTVGVVTKPFHFEGAHRMRISEQGIEELQHQVDTLIIIPNQNLFRVANEKTTFADAFKMADNVLYSGVRSITDLMIIPGLINLDFADIRTVMSEMGKSMMGTGEAEGDNRAILAAESAIANPLLDEVSMRGSKGVLISITGGMDMTLFEVDEAANRIRDEVDPDTNIIFGSTFDEKLNGKIRVSVVATGIDSNKSASVLHDTARGVSRSQSQSQEPTSPTEEEKEDNPSPWTTATDQVEETIVAAEPQQEASKLMVGDIDSGENDSSTQALPAEYTPELAAPSAPTMPHISETRRRPGLFERFTRSLRGSAPTAKATEAQVRVLTPGPAGGDLGEEQVSEVPAFLRKQGR